MTRLRYQSAKAIHCKTADQTDVMYRLCTFVVYIQFFSDEAKFTLLLEASLKDLLKGSPKRLSLLKKSVVRITKHPDVTSAVLPRIISKKSNKQKSKAKYSKYLVYCKI